MPTYFNSQISDARRKRARFLKDAVKNIATYRKYSAASESTTIDFNRAYNSPVQKERYGQRSREKIAKEAVAALEQAKNDFKEACRNCPYRLTVCRKDTQVEAKKAKEDIFWELVDNSSVRDRLFQRLENPDAKMGRKAMCCRGLMKKGQTKKSDWDW